MFHVEPNRIKRIAQPKDHLVSNETFDICLDFNTQIAKTLPRPPLNELSKYYATDKYISHQNKRISLFQKLYGLVQRVMFFKKKSWISPFLADDKSYLDFGCGTGALVEYLQNEGWKAYGVEPNEKARKVLSNDQIVGTTAELTEQEFNTIGLWHVLEHLPDPEKTINDLLERLSKDGKLLIAVPNFKSWDANHYKSYWAAYDVPRHLWHFSSDGLESFGKSLDLTIVEKRGLFFDAFYVSYLSEKHKKTFFPLLMGCLKGLYSNIRAFFNGEYSSLLIIFKKKT